MQLSSRRFGFLSKTDDRGRPSPRLCRAGPAEVGLSVEQERRDPRPVARGGRRDRMVRARTDAAALDRGGARSRLCRRGDRSARAAREGAADRLSGQRDGRRARAARARRHLSRGADWRSSAGSRPTARAAAIMRWPTPARAIACSTTSPSRRSGWSRKDGGAADDRRLRRASGRRHRRTDRGPAGDRDLFDPCREELPGAQGAVDARRAAGRRDGRR